MKISVQQFESIYRKQFQHISKLVLFKVPQVSDAEDVVANVFTDFYQLLRKKEIEIENVEAYLVQMAKNELSSFYKKKSKLVLIEDVWEDKYIDIQADFDLEETLFNQFSVEVIEKKLKLLSALDQRIIVAKIKFEMSFKEIAEQLKVKENSVKTRYYRGLELLKNECRKELAL